MSRLRNVPLTAVGFLVVGLLMGLAAPAAAHAGAAVVRAINGSQITKHSISGDRLKNNTLTGTQIDESKLGTVPNAAKLGGRPATSFVTTGHEQLSGVIKIPTGGASHVLFQRYPLTWSGTCTVNGSSDSYTLTVTAAEPVVYQERGNFGSQIAKGASLEIDNGGGNGTPVQDSLDYSVYGTDGAQYMGEFMTEFKDPAAPCAVAITAVG